MLFAKASETRTLGDFDVTHDGHVDAADLAAVDALAARAKALAETRRIDAGTKAGLYGGRKLELDGNASLSADAPVDAIKAFVIESRWLVDQTRFAAVLAWEPDALLSGALARHIPGYNSESMSPPTLCLAVDTLDLASFARAGLPAVVVTDLDFTMWQGDVSNTFLGVIAEKKLARSEVNPAVIGYLTQLGGIDTKRVRESSVHDNIKLLYQRATDTTLPKDQRVNIKDAFFLTVRVLEGLDVATVEDAAMTAMTKGAFGAPGIAARFHTDASGCGTQALLAKLKNRGIDVYFLSATLDVLATAAARSAGIPDDHAIGSVCEVVDGRYTGQVIGSTYEIKGPVLRQWVGVPPLMVFGDSPTSDMPMMLEAVGAGFMVNPRPEIIDKDNEVAGGRLVSVTFTPPSDHRANAGK